MPPKTRPKCPAVPLALLEWLERVVPEPEFNPDPLTMANAAGKREIVRTLRHHYELQQKKDP